MANEENGKNKERLRTIANKKKVVEALEKSLGIVSIACRSVGISRRTYYKWLDEDEDFRKEVSDVYEVQGDYVEGKLLDAIRNGDISSIIFYCKTKLKKRGYVERTEQSIDIASVQPININILEDKE